MAESVETVVIGAGVVGLAIARALALQGREVIILEAESAFGTGISARNSEVVHAGLYYPKDSLKARFCVQGRKALYDFAASHGVPLQKCGKLVVATSDTEVPALARIREKAMANGVDDLEELTAAEACALEPALACRGALLSPSTGIVDSHALMLAMLGDAESEGAMLALNAPMLTGKVSGTGFVLEVGGSEAMTLECRQVINSAGLSAPGVAQGIEGMPPSLVPQLWLARGNYFSLEGRSPFTRLIYPVPESAGLGVHLTLDLGGAARFGPDVEWIQEIDYQVDPARGERFYASIRRYWPELKDGSLHADYAGIRPKIQAPGDPARDFMIQGADVHGISGLVNLFGIESPGLTASLAIGDYVADMLASNGV